jgi:hypothetical protein
MQMFADFLRRKSIECVHSPRVTLTYTNCGDEIIMGSWRQRVRNVRIFRINHCSRETELFLTVWGNLMFLKLGDSFGRWSNRLSAGGCQPAHLCVVVDSIYRPINIYIYIPVGRVNCCWRSPTQSFSVLGPAGLMNTYFTVSWLWESCHYSYECIYSVSFPFPTTDLVENRQRCYEFFLHTLANTGQSMAVEFLDAIRILIPRSLFIINYIIGLYFLAKPISLRSILMLSSHLCLCFLSGLFPSGFPTKILYASPFPPFYLPYRSLFSWFSVVKTDRVERRVREFHFGWTQCFQNTNCNPPVHYLYTTIQQWSGN